MNLFQKIVLNTLLCAVLGGFNLFAADPTDNSGRIADGANFTLYPSLTESQIQRLIFSNAAKGPMEEAAVYDMGRYDAADAADEADELDDSEEWVAPGIVDEADEPAVDEDEVYDMDAFGGLLAATRFNEEFKSRGYDTNGIDFGSEFLSQYAEDYPSGQDLTAAQIDQVIQKRLIKLESQKIVDDASKLDDDSEDMDSRWDADAIKVALPDLKNETGDLFARDLADFHDQSYDSEAAPVRARVAAPVMPLRADVEDPFEDLIDPSSHQVRPEFVSAPSSSPVTSGSSLSTIAAQADVSAPDTVIFINDPNNLVDIDAALIKSYDYRTILTLNLAEREQALYTLGRVVINPVNTPGSSPREILPIESADLTNINVVSLEQELLTNGKAVPGLTDIYATAILKNDLAKKVALNHSWREAI